MTESDRIDQFKTIMLGIADNYMISDLRVKGFFKAPASRSYHGAYEGGLFDHCYEVTTQLVDITNANGLKWHRRESPYIVGMFHDLCKIDTYDRGNDPYTYNEDMLLKDHGDKSIMLLSQYMILTLEEIMCIRYHMGAFTEKEEWKDYTRAVNAFPNVLWTHTADMLAAYVTEV